MKAICTLGRPVIFVLEDLQNIDKTSGDLLSSLINNSIKNIMLIGAYRDEEVGDAHQVTNILQDIKKNNISLTEIKLKNLEPEQVNELISDALQACPMETYPLTAIVHRKTKGNPFFINQMLNSLYEEKLISFCDQKQKWTWDISSLDEKQDIAENVTELLKQKILSLPKETQDALKIASCLRDSFSFPTLEGLLGICVGINDALDKGLISKGSDNMYRFVHTQVREVVVDLLPKEHRNTVYLYVGKKLWTLITKKGLKEELSTAVDLLKHVIGIVTDEKERLKMTYLFMETGKQAMKSTAFGKAFTYFKVGIKLLSADTWEKKYGLSLKMYNQAAIAAYSNQSFSKMKTFLDVICAKATSALHLVQCYVIQIRYNNDKRQFAQAIEK